MATTTIQPAIHGYHNYTTCDTWLPQLYNLQYIATTTIQPVIHSYHNYTTYNTWLSQLYNL